ncbi:TPA: hypothetical protein ACUKJV_004652 [Escherichia coli]|jgi:hypothetical protein|uniref:hypothetical protein n=1 Tax=Enterobacteriaceae TaxID=543 RepID=UPI000338FA99|nr:MULTISPECIES: hypothetical protein [Enterobacteriaceae]ECN8698882.1 hypothetical protein [Salmonella enterica subsp. enterica serovar Enteritidis]EFW2041720.1 hypothetical protein [Shigella flexneri]MDU1681364.1 hypothetical protein [Veillonella sp.]CFY60365.1 Uncharacterised protein [Salmonella enterica subsp. enterica serovar Typhi]HBP1426362.1 hypothetical protein [Escherichia coli str. K-12 substr. MG1655star]
MTTLTDKELIKEIKERIGSLDVRDNIERRAYEIALASLEAEPVAWECGENIILFNPDTVEAYAKRAEISPKPLFSAPPTVVVPDDGREKFEALVRFHAGDKNHETLLIRANEGMNYQDPNVDLAWIFWKSSREHI